jgi:hypothetical protein
MKLGHECLSFTRHVKCDRTGRFELWRTRRSFYGAARNGRVFVDLDEPHGVLWIQSIDNDCSPGGIWRGDGQLIPHKLLKQRLCDEASQLSSDKIEVMRSRALRYAAMAQEQEPTNRVLVDLVATTPEPIVPAQGSRLRSRCVTFTMQHGVSLYRVRFGTTFELNDHAFGGRCCDFEIWELDENGEYSGGRYHGGTVPTDPGDRENWYAWRGIFRISDEDNWFMRRALVERQRRIDAVDSRAGVR